MNPVDKIARLGWFATATLALATVSACARTQTETQTPVSTTATTSAQVADRDGVELYFARLAASSKCGGDLRENVDFLPRSASIDKADMPDIDRWAACLNEPQMQHATVVLVGGQARSEPDGLFVARAGRVRDALIARGVEARRIVIGTQNASRDGTPFAGNTGVRVETTHQQSLREFVPPDTGARATIPIH
jgi:hypothetical protein